MRRSIAVDRPEMPAVQPAAGMSAELRVLRTPAIRLEPNGKERCYMSTFKLICVVALVLVSSAITVASASAAETLWRLLPGSAKETFTGKTGSVTLETVGGAKIRCTSATILLTSGGSSSELLETGGSLALAVMHFVGCKAEEILPMNSKGDEKEVFLTHLEVHFCLIKKGDLGLKIEFLPLTIEVPTVMLTIEVKGAFIALIAPLEAKDTKHFELNIKQTKGVQEIEKCEGGVKQTLLSKTDAGVVEEAGEGITEKTGLLLFDGAIDKEGEALMEN
jgi:hypothetical protein